MKKLFTLIIPVIFIGLLAVGCGKNGGAAPDIQGIDSYTDTYSGAVIKYPKNWVKFSAVGSKFIAYNSNDARKRFQKYDAEGFPGAKVEMLIVTIDSGKTLESVITENKPFEDQSLYKEEAATIDGVQGKKLSYTFDQDNGKFNGEMYVATKDNQIATILIIESFDGTWEKYAASFKEIAASLKLGAKPAEKGPAVAAPTEAEGPSTTLTTKSGDGFSMGVPENFRSETDPLKSSSSLRSYFYVGQRRGDSFLKVELFDASKTKNLSKIVDENKAKFGGNPVKTSLGGAEAYSMNFNPTKDVKGKIWFALKGGKLYRVSMYWFKGEEQTFLPIFDKCVRSFKFE